MITGFVEAMVLVLYGPLMDLAAVAIALSMFVAVALPFWEAGRLLRRLIPK